MKEAAKVYELSIKVDELKEKGGPAFQEQWDLYCARFAESKRADTATMCSAQLDGFLKHYDSGYQLTSVASALRRTMIRSPDLWRAWLEYLSNTYGDAYASSQPYRFHESHAINFLKHLTVDTSAVIKNFRSEAVAVNADEHRRLLVRKVTEALRDPHNKEMWQQFLNADQGKASWRSLNVEAQSDSQLEGFLRREAPEMLDSHRDSLCLQVDRYRRKSKKRAKEWESFVAARIVDGKSKVSSDPLSHSLEVLEAFVAEHLT